MRFFVNQVLRHAPSALMGGGAGLWLIHALYDQMVVDSYNNSSPILVNVCSFLAGAWLAVVCSIIVKDDLYITRDPQSLANRELLL